MQTAGEAMPEQSDDHAFAAARAFIGRDAYAKSLGIIFGEIALGRARATMVVRPDMVNAHGSCHGGAIFSLADSVFAVVCNSRGQVAVAQFCSVGFLRPAAVGDELEAEGVESVASGQRGIYDITVSCRGEVVAAFRGHARIVGGKSKGDQ
jgi:phenylacetic acid degradation protein PaaD